MKTNKKAKKKYLELLARAKKARHYIFEHPGITYHALCKGLFPMQVPLMWLYQHGYVYRKGGVVVRDGKLAITPCVYFVNPIGEDPKEEFDENTESCDPAIEDVVSYRELAASAQTL